MTFYYLRAESIRDINIAFCGEGAGVRDENGFLSVVERPQTNVFGRELFPDVYSKASAYLHGFATTQFFTDGNKRTGFLSATVFLRIHGLLWIGPEVNDAEEFLLEVAAKKHDERAVAKWLKYFSASQPAPIRLEGRG
ncbi:Fic family protein [uncultured Microbacterium sp.]|uniref:type II toxin-antitoxin system death-on-curing family toxin n=1 Tax=uncultured Microbacterium sp. TaxID=191216 RepID=UPI0025D07873|nr:Fic family protein [uncultured Microbacterium sp.]